ncbi:GtrA family protein [Rhizobium sp.]|jgi:putative flippase GtrA|uniref:GtrA family protein n=1 Tax=Rhizobium sp. TaxID=391 RepID=UPI000E800741|nr:GtrA family protein [Rhizobium sp.]
MKKLIRFALVGTAGFAVDAGVLWLLLEVTPFGAFISRIFAIALAMMTTWMFNRAFTFGASKRTIVAEGFRYGSVGVVSALVNYGIYAGLLLTVPALNPFFALIAASLAAMVFSFFGYSRFVFGEKR